MGEDFDCAICQRRVCLRWNQRGALRQFPPICRGCESHYGKRPISMGPGTFRDRREIARGHAISEALRCEAAQQKWRQADARA